MAATLRPNGQPIFRKRVTKIAPSLLTVIPPKLVVSVHDEQNSRSFNHVVSTLPFGAFRMVDTEQCGLSYTLKTAMRMLHYGGSVKVGIQFTERWWEPTHKGGVSKTDRPTRVVVYPSYGIGDPASGASILVSYTWGQDALRQGALVQGHRSISEEILLKLILEDLSAMHQIPYDTLSGKVKAFHEWNWYGDQFQVGKHMSPGSLHIYFLPNCFSIQRCLRTFWSWTIQHLVSGSDSTSCKWTTPFCRRSHQCEPRVSFATFGVLQFTQMVYFT